MLSGKYIVRRIVGLNVIVYVFEDEFTFKLSAKESFKVILLRIL